MINAMTDSATLAPASHLSEVRQTINLTHEFLTQLEEVMDTALGIRPESVADDKLSNRSGEFGEASVTMEILRSRLNRNFERLHNFRSALGV